MPPEEIDFQTFFTARIKERGATLKKLSEATGISPMHLESLVHGRFEDLPSAPYVHGYLTRLGKALDFDGEAWWEKIKKERLVGNSGPNDALPHNRFLRESPAKMIWGGAIAVLVVVYLAFQIPVIFSKPSLTVAFPSSNPFTTNSSTLTFEGTVSGANSLSLNGDPITVAQDGSWEKSVLLQSGVNSFSIAAKRLLGREADITEEIIYNGSGFIESASSSASSTSGAGSTSTAASSSGRALP
jgi:cytoskeletal protein RodZ